MRLSHREILESIAMGGDPLIYADVHWTEPGMGSGILTVSAPYSKPVTLIDGRKFCVICKRYGGCPHDQ